MIDRLLEPLLVDVLRGGGPGGDGLDVELDVRGGGRPPFITALAETMPQNRKQPASRPVRIANLTLLLVGRQEHLLRQVFRIRRRAGQTVCVAVDRFEVFGHQLGWVQRAGIVAHILPL